MVEPSSSMLDLCLLPRTEAAIEFDRVVAAFTRWGWCVCGSNDEEEMDVGVLAERVQMTDNGPRRVIVA